jgi:hypothetical protein
MAVPGVSSGTTSLATSIAPCKTYFFNWLGLCAYIKFWKRPNTNVLGTLKGNCKVIFTNKTPFIKHLIIGAAVYVLITVKVRAMQLDGGAYMQALKIRFIV